MGHHGSAVQWMVQVVTRSVHGAVRVLWVTDVSGKKQQNESRVGNSVNVNEILQIL